ncbi:MAG: ATP-binding protein [Candidatus Hodarchaeota archaeon]
MADLPKLKQNLQEELSKEAFDYSKVLSLSQQIAALDEDNVRFSVDASHISRLGLELVAKQETAVAELVKNGYDADASQVDLIFKDVDNPGGNLEITDNGHGMTRQQLINGFMRISTADKSDNPVSTRYKRQRAGRKGIGRFSAQRLGTKVTITTQTKDSPYALKVIIDWDKFEPHLNLSDISNHIELIDKKTEHGTTLFIENLRDAWTDGQLKRAFRYVASLLQPFPLSKKTDENYSVDPGFKTAFFREINGDIVKVIDEEESIFEHALAEAWGHVDQNGKGYWSMSCERYDIEIENQPVGPDRNDPTSVYEELRNVNFKAYYFIPLSDLIPKISITHIREILQKSGGIRLYRNGFRVLPYGEPFNDWLWLDKSSASRQILPPHANLNYLGFVEIHDIQGEKFEETSSREGLVENQAFSELQQYVSVSVKSLALKVAEARGRKGKASERTSYRDENTPKRRAAKILELLDETKSQDEPKDKKEHDRTEDKDERTNYEEIKEGIKLLGDEGEELLEEIGMLRVLACLGLTIGEFTHEIRHSLSALVSSFKLLRVEKDNSGSSELRFEDIDVNLESLQAYAKYFDRAIRDNVHRKLEAQEIRDVLNMFERVAQPLLKREEIVLEKEIKGYDLFARPMHNSEWASILLNLLTNSVKAVKRAKVQGKILIRAGEDNENLYLEFADNGDGIPEENQDRIFDAFYTTTSPADLHATESEQLVGTGLGLKIVKDIVEAAYGEIYLCDPPESYKTCFRIEIPKASETEIPADAY